MQWAYPQIGYISPSPVLNHGTTSTEALTIQRVVDDISLDIPITEQACVGYLTSLLSKSFPERTSAIESARRFWDGLMKGDLQVMQDNLSGVEALIKRVEEYERFTNRSPPPEEWVTLKRLVLHSPAITGVIEVFRNNNRYGYGLGFLRRSLLETVQNEMESFQSVHQYLNSPKAVLIASGFNEKEIVQNLQQVTEELWYRETIDSIKAALEQGGASWTREVRQKVNEALKQRLEEKGVSVRLPRNDRRFNRRYLLKTPLFHPIGMEQEDWPTEEKKGAWADMGEVVESEEAHFIAEEELELFSLAGIRQENSIPQTESELFSYLVTVLQKSSPLIRSSMECYKAVQQMREGLTIHDKAQVETSYQKIQEAIQNIKSTYQLHQREVGTGLDQLERLIKRTHHLWNEVSELKGRSIFFRSLFEENLRSLDSYLALSEERTIFKIAGFDLGHLRLNLDFILAEALLKEKRDSQASEEEIFGLLYALVTQNILSPLEAIRLQQTELKLDDEDLLEYPLFGENRQSVTEKMENRILEWIKKHPWISIPVLGLLIVPLLIGYIGGIVSSLQHGQSQSRSSPTLAPLQNLPGPEANYLKELKEKIQAEIKTKEPPKIADPVQAWKEAKQMFEERIAEFKETTPKRFQQDKFKDFNEKVKDPKEREKRYSAFMKTIQDPSLPSPSDILEAMKRVIAPTPEADLSADGRWEDEDLMSILEEAMKHGFPQIVADAWLEEGSSQEAGVRTVIQGKEVLLLNFPFLLSSDAYLHVLIHELWHGILQSESTSGRLHEGITELLTTLTSEELGRDYYWGSYLGELFSTKILMEMNEEQLTELYRGVDRHGLSYDSFLNGLEQDFFPEISMEDRTKMRSYFKSSGQLKSLEFMDIFYPYAKEHGLAAKLIQQMKRPQLLFQSYFTWRFVDYNLLKSDESKTMLNTVLIPGLVSQVKTNPLTMWLIREVIAYSYYDLVSQAMTQPAFEVVDDLLAKKAIDEETAQRWKEYLAHWRWMPRGRGGEGAGVEPSSDFPTTDELSPEMNPNAIEEKGGDTGASHIPNDVSLEGKDQGKGESVQERAGFSDLLGKWNHVIDENMQKAQGDHSEMDLKKVLQELLDTRLHQWMDYLIQMPEGDEKDLTGKLFSHLLGYQYKSPHSQKRIWQSASPAVVNQIVKRYLSEYIAGLLKKGDIQKAYENGFQRIPEVLQSYPSATGTWIRFTTENLLLFLNDHELENHGFSAGYGGAPHWLEAIEQRCADILTQVRTVAGETNQFSQQELQKVLKKIADQYGIHSCLRILTQVVFEGSTSPLPGYYHQELRKTLSSSVRTIDSSQEAYEKRMRYSTLSLAFQLLWRSSGQTDDLEQAFRYALESLGNEIGLGYFFSSLESSSLTSLTTREALKSQYIERLKQSLIADQEKLPFLDSLVKFPEDVVRAIYPTVKNVLTQKVMSAPVNHSDWDSLSLASQLLLLDKILDDPMERGWLFPLAEEKLKSLREGNYKTQVLKCYLYRASRQPWNLSDSEWILKALDQLTWNELTSKQYLTAIDHLVPDVNSIWESLILTAVQLQDKGKIYAEKIVDRLDKVKVKKGNLAQYDTLGDQTYYSAMAFLVGYNPRGDSQLKKRIEFHREGLQNALENITGKMKDYDSVLFGLLNQSPYLDKENFLEFWRLIEKLSALYTITYQEAKHYEQVFSFIHQRDLKELLPDATHCLLLSIAEKKPQQIGEFLNAVKAKLPEAIRLEFEVSLYFQYRYPTFQWKFNKEVSEWVTEYGFQEIPPTIQQEAEQWLRDHIQTDPDAQRVKNQLVITLKHEIGDIKRDFGSFHFLEFPVEGINLKARYAASLWRKQMQSLWLFKKWPTAQETYISRNQEALKNLNQCLKTITSMDDRIRLSDEDTEKIFPNGELILDSLQLYLRHPTSWITLWVLMTGLVSFWTRYESNKKWGEFLSFANDLWGEVKEEKKEYEIKGPGFAIVADPEGVWQKLLKSSPRKLRRFFHQHPLSTDEKALFLTLLYAEYSLLQGRLGMTEESFRKELLQGLKRLLLVPEIKAALANKRIARDLNLMDYDIRWRELYEDRQVRVHVPLMIQILGYVKAYAPVSRKKLKEVAGNESRIGPLNPSLPQIKKEDQTLFEEINHVMIQLAGEGRLSQAAQEGRALVLKTEDLADGMRLEDGSHLGSSDTILVPSEKRLLEFGVFPVGGRSQTDPQLKRSIAEIKSVLGKITPMPVGGTYTLQKIRESLLKNQMDHVIISSHGSYVSVGYMTKENEQVLG